MNHNNRLIPLDAPVPPNMEKALGYERDARYVAFYWTPAGDQAMYDDGEISGTGEWPAWLDFTQHPLVDPHLQRYDFGSSDFEADDYLLLDRQERKAYVAPVHVARDFLAAQHPPRPRVNLTATPDALRSALAQTLQVDMAQVEAQAQVAQEEHLAMLRWLDQQGAE